MLNVDSMIAILNEYSNIAFIISICISIIIALAGILPSVFVTCANIIFFGPIKGFIISIAGETIGAYITFKIYRMGIKKTASGFVEKYSILKNMQKSSSIKSGILIFEGRLMPFIPSGFVTLAAAFSSVNDFIFIVSTLLGKMPSIFMEALISYDFINIKENYIRLFLSIFVIILLYITVKKSK